jgi:hypothetical protein
VAVALLPFEANPGAAGALAPVEALVASRLAEAPGLRVVSQQDIATAIGVERQKQVLGGDCNDSDCYAELTGAVGARYLVKGRVDRLGSVYVLSANVFDSHRAVSVAKPRAEASEEADLVPASEQLVREIFSSLGVVTETATKPDRPIPQSGSVALRMGTQLLTAQGGFNPGADVELGWRFHPEWLALLQLGFNLVRSEDGSGLTVQPGVLGVRKLYRVERAFQPYWGLGLGLQLSIGQFGFFSATESFPTVLGSFGGQYLFTDRFGVMLDFSTNIAQTIMGLRHRESTGKGLNFDISFGVNYQF